jgi:TP901 family phage tail tape measure protein
VSEVAAERIVSTSKVTIGTDDRKLDKGLKTAEDKIGASLKRMGDKLTRTGTTLSKGLTAPVLAVGAASLKMAVDTDKGLREVNSLFGKTGKAAEVSFGQMQKGVKNLSNELGLAQTDVIPGLYQSISAGVPKKNLFDFMRTAGKASIAGVTDITTSVNGLSSIINAFGLKATDAERVADSMFTAVRDGKTTFKELSDAIFNVAPAAAAANVKMEEVTASISTMTASGVPTSVATTQIRAALVGLQRPSKELDRIFKAQGYSNAQAAVKAKGFVWALKQVKDATGGNNGALQMLLGSTEAVSAANILAGTGAKKFAHDLADQGKKAGATDKAFEEINKSSARKLERMKVRFQNLAISLGTALLPVLDKVSAWFDKVSVAVSKLDPHTKKLIVVIAAVVATVGPVLIVFGKFISLIGSSVKAIGTLVKVMNVLRIAMLTNPVGIIITALALLAVGLYMAWKRSETFRRIVTGAFNAIKRVAHVAVTFIRHHWRLLLAMLGGPLLVVIAKVIGRFGGIRRVGGAVFRALVSPIKTVIGWVKTLIGWVRKISSVRIKVKTWHGIPTGVSVKWGDGGGKDDQPSPDEGRDAADDLGSLTDAQNRKIAARKKKKDAAERKPDKPTAPRTPPATTKAAPKTTHPSKPSSTLEDRLGGPGWWAKSDKQNDKTRKHSSKEHDKDRKHAAAQTERYFVLQHGYHTQAWFKEQYGTAKGYGAYVKQHEKDRKHSTSEHAKDRKHHTLTQKQVLAKLKEQADAYKASMKSFPSAMNTLLSNFAPDVFHRTRGGALAINARAGVGRSQPAAQPAVVHHHHGDTNHNVTLKYDPKYPHKPTTRAEMEHIKNGIKTAGALTA